jgi:hypothetical protein
MKKVLTADTHGFNFNVANNKALSDLGLPQSVWLQSVLSFPPRRDFSGSAAGGSKFSLGGTAVPE